MTSIDLPAAAPRAPSTDTTSAGVALRVWLWAVVALVLAIVIVGGATRLTDSGLSITEWNGLRINGWLPPLGEAAWLAEFDKYRGTNEYQVVNGGMALADFKVIYLWEWGHRILGKVIGLVFLGGLVWFWLRGQARGRLGAGLAGVFALICVQGAIGWWMVTSGLGETSRIDVAPYRLATHLTLACIILAATTFIATGLAGRAHGDEPAGARSTRGHGVFAAALLAALLAQVFLGALVAGNKAGLIYNTWPLMDGAIAPPAAALFPHEAWWRNLFEGHALVQLNHRIMAYALVFAAIWHAIAALRDRRLDAKLKGSAASLAVLMLGQAILGVATLLLMAPLWAALAHQFYAAALVVVAAMHARRMMGAARPAPRGQAAARA
jgi:cytochrome c oxidase assembly protein subunit 15